MSKKPHTFIVSDHSNNSHGFVVKTEGINLEKFNKNPIMFYMHERSKIIGRWENVRIEGENLLADAVFDTSDELGKEIERKVSEGFLKSASLGISYSKENVKDNVLESCTLYEISIVSIGSNSNALKLYNNQNIASLHFEDLSLLNGLKSLNIDGVDLAQPLLTNDKVQLSTAIKAINLQFEQLTQFKTQVETERVSESEGLINLALQRKVIPANLVELQKDAFKSDYAKAKEGLITSISNSFPKKYFNYVQFLEDERIRKASGTKSKSNWTLEDYRVNAPKELQKDPELYKRLLNQEYNQN